MCFFFKWKGYVCYIWFFGLDVRVILFYVMILINWFDWLIYWWLKDVGYKFEVEVFKGVDRIFNIEFYVVSSSFWVNFIFFFLVGGRVFGFLWWRRGLFFFLDNMLLFSVLIKVWLLFGEFSVKLVFFNML